ncbi:MAG: M48 family metalloprotease [Acidobacteria bacterium]|nr:M48 family metalloprotease [Acidobacteriota bacterium]
MNAQFTNGHQVNHQFPQPLVCPNGHSGSPEGGRFCIRCGVQLVAWPQQMPVPQPVRPMMPVQQFTPVPQQAFCHVCSGNGRTLDTKVNVCPGCRWLRPLVPGYNVDPSAFQWAQDGQAMATLRSMTTLTSIARSISDKAGRKWVETTFNGVRLSEKQMPDVYTMAVKAARILGMSSMPDIYVSGERSWDALTFGSDQNAFIVLGSALVTSFQGEDLLFLLAREMGHCRTGHALWKTVIRFLIGEQRPKQGMMAGGVLSMLDPGKLIEGALEMPLLAWARQAEITADRAGLLAIGNEETARRVLLTWSLKSPILYRHINTEAWLEQQEDDGINEMTKLSEMTSSSTPYLTRRLKLMSQFAQSRELNHWHSMIKQSLPQATGAEPHPANPVAPPKAAEDTLRISCPACKTGMRIPRNVLADKDSLSVRCPNQQCGKVNLLKLKKTTPEEQFAD